MNAKTHMEICGHAKTRALLDRIVVAPFHPQSFLFFGPKHLGKSLVAREFALKLIGTPTLSNGFHPDLLTLGEEDGEKGESMTLSVEQVREAQGFLSRFPESGRYRVVIIDHAERLTRSAENALLKVLEEPNTSSILILVCSRPAKLLPTVRSRLFPVSFSLLSSETLHQCFPETSELPEFFFSLGLPGLLQKAIDEPQSFDETKGKLKKLFQLSRLSWAERISLAETLAASPDELENILAIWIIGLAKRRDGSDGRTRAEAVFLESVIETINLVAERQGSPRLLMEKLFTAL